MTFTPPLSFVAQALPELLNSKPFAFVIDLAILASRREYLKLDKWVTDKMLEHGDQFVQACVGTLKRRCPAVLGEWVMLVGRLGASGHAGRCWADHGVAGGRP